MNASLPMPGRGESANRWRPASAAGLALLLVGASAITATADTVLSQQWHLDVMKAEEMWRTSTGEGVTVALIDTGVREAPELAGQLPGGPCTRPGQRCHLLILLYPDAAAARFLPTCIGGNRSASVSVTEGEVDGFGGIRDRVRGNS